VPYRIDLKNPPDDALDRLVRLGAIDLEATDTGLAALLPDEVEASEVERALGVERVERSPAVSRDDGSVWVLRPRPVRTGGIVIVPADMPAPPGALKLIDGSAFGTGLHPTTAQCLDLLEEMIGRDHPGEMLDVGTGSGILALAALQRGIRRAVALDLDSDALRVAAENARVNELGRRLLLVRGGPDALRGSWPLVVANILAAPLIEAAPGLARRVGHGGRLVLSGIAALLEREVGHAYRRCGMRPLRSVTRAGWTTLVLAPSW
jgi:ribosomal protein L11 methyltransferase